MPWNKTDLYEAVNKDMDQIRKCIDQHHCLLASILNGTDSRDQLEWVSKHRPYMTREEKLKEAIQETIETLEQSKKSFKSKRLENLRNRLTRVLMETG